MISVTASSYILFCIILLIVYFSTSSCTSIPNIHVMHLSEFSYIPSIHVMRRSVFTLLPNYLLLSLLQFTSSSTYLSLSVASGEAVTDMVTVASDLFHVVNGAFTMKKMCEQSMNQSLHDGSVDGEHFHCVQYIPVLSFSSFL